MREMAISTQDIGVIIKADTIGALEALAGELSHIEVPISIANLGTSLVETLLKRRPQVTHCTPLYLASTSMSCPTPKKQPRSREFVYS